MSRTVKEAAEKNACRLSACLSPDMKLKGAKVLELDVAKRADMKRTLQNFNPFTLSHRGARSTFNPTAMRKIPEQARFSKGVVATGDVLIEDKLLPIFLTSSGGL